VGREDYIFALGVLSANFNELEGVLQLLFSINVRIPFEAMIFMFARSDNAQRIKILQGCLTELPYIKRDKDAIEYFLRGYARCAENRNILLHSEISTYGNKTKRKRVIFYKDSKKPPHDPTRYTPSITTLRAIADAMRKFAGYGSDLGFFLRDAYWMEQEVGLRNIRKPLPLRPPLPRLLVPQRFADSNLPRAH
jgi:hypothetical protein